MTSSEQINELAAALSKAQGAMKNAPKDTENPFFRSRYADLASVWDACRKPLTDQGLSIIQVPEVTFGGEPEFESYRTKTGDERWRAKVITTVNVRTRLLHTSGQWIDDDIKAVLPSGDPQSIGSAITYLRRYALSAMVGVAPEDDDAEAATARPNGTGYSESNQTPAGHVRPSTHSSLPAAPAGPSTDPNGGIYVRHIEHIPTRKANVTRHEITLSTGEVVATIKDGLSKLAEQACRDERPVEVETKRTQYGVDLVSLKYADDAGEADEAPPLTDADIPFFWLLPLLLTILGLVGA